MARNLRTHFENGAARNGRTHMFHEIGRDECVQEGCEPRPQSDYDAQEVAYYHEHGIPHPSDPDSPASLAGHTADAGSVYGQQQHEIDAWGDIIKGAQDKIRNMR